MAHPATEKRGGNPDVKHKPEHQKAKDAMERKLEQGLEESMTGSDPVSVTQPPKTDITKRKRAEASFQVSTPSDNSERTIRSRAYRLPLTLPSQVKQRIKSLR